MISFKIFFLCVVVFIANYLWKYRRFFYLASKIPYSDHDYSLKGIKNMLKAEPKIIFQMVYDAYKNKTHTSKTWFGTILFVAVVKPEDVKIILNSKACLDKPRNVKFMNIPKGTLFGDLEYWQSHRKIMNPYFGAQALKSVIPILNEKVKIMMKNVRKMEGKGEFDVLNFAMALALETALKTMEYDVDIQSQKEEIRDSFMHNLEKYVDIVSTRMFKFWLHPDFIYTRTSAYQKEVETRSKMCFKFSDQIVQNAQKKFDVDESGSDSKYNKSFLRGLLDPKNNLTISEVCDEVKTVLGAAQDTTAVAISSAILLLAMNKDVQQKVVDELRAVFGNVTEAPFMDIENLNELVYLEMVINESMRILPVVPIITRKVLTEVSITDGYILPEETYVLIPISVLHHSKEIWGDDVGQFRPERFEKENFEKIHPYGFIPFAKGPRICLGWRYAMYMMKIQLANFLLRYELDTSLKFEELNFKMHITMTACQGYMISITERTN